MEIEGAVGPSPETPSEEQEPIRSLLFSGQPEQVFLTMPYEGEAWPKRPG